jgi:hypothetical protein
MNQNQNEIILLNKLNKIAAEQAQIQSQVEGLENSGVDTVARESITNIVNGDEDIMIKNNNEIQRFLNIEVGANTSVSTAITNDIFVPRGYIIAKTDTSHEFGVRVDRKMGVTATFGEEIDSIQAIAPNTCVSAMGEIVDLRGVALEVTIDNFSSSTHYYDIVVMGVAL